MSPGDLVFDVGANDGDRTRVFRSLGARVVAVEPQPGCIEMLERSYGSDANVEIVGKALAAADGTAQLMLNESAVLSSMSQDFIAATEESGRFAQWSNWSGAMTVETTTLDRLIDIHGRPAFCKIDVEGFEAEVLQGLSQPLPMVSIEYTAETLDSLVRSIDRLTTLGFDRFAFSPAESFAFSAAGWGDGQALVAGLKALDDPRAWGDVYAGS